MYFVHLSKDQTLMIALSDRGAKEILQEYYEKIGGRPMYRAISIPKRGRQPAGGTSAPVSAAPKNTKRARTSFGASSSKSNGDDASPAPVELTTKKNWDEDATIDTIEKTSKGLVCYVHW
jgi:chromobox protein 1